MIDSEYLLNNGFILEFHPSGCAWFLRVSSTKFMQVSIDPQEIILYNKGNIICNLSLEDVKQFINEQQSKEI